MKHRILFDLKFRLFLVLTLFDVESCHKILLQLGLWDIVSFTVGKSPKEISFIFLLGILGIHLRVILSCCFIFRIGIINILALVLITVMLTALLLFTLVTIYLFNNINQVSLLDLGHLELLGNHCRDLLRPVNDLFLIL